MKHLTLATAGHVDHGKSALVRALTGTDPDRLPEEKARGITIDLGFAELSLGEIEVGLVDVPGHEDFIKNMVAGVGSVDAALLVVAADDGWMPQTEEHLQILEYLGVRRGVVALSKADLAEEVAAAAAGLRERLRGSSFADAPIVPTSLQRPESIAELRAALAALCASLPAPFDAGKPRLPVDRAFSLRGVGTVVTGTLTGGCLARGDVVMLQPSGATARIRAIQSHGREVQKAGPGQRVALNLPDVDLGGVRRGDAAVLASMGKAGLLWDVLLTGSARASSPALKSGREVRVHHGSGAATASLRLVGNGRLARLRFAKPVFGLIGDRFILRDSSGRHTLAGGVLLDAWPPPTLRAAQRESLSRRAEALTPQVFVEMELGRHKFLPRATLGAQTWWSMRELEGALAQAVISGAWVVEAAWWNTQRERISSAVASVHRAHPEKPGLDLGEARALLPKAPPELVDALVAELERNGVVRRGASLALAGHRAALPGHLQAAGARLRQALAANPLDPPARSQLAPDAPSAQALRFLVGSGEAVELSSELAMDAAAFRNAERAVAEHLRARGPATVSELRQALGTSRRVIVPLLERLDRAGVTLRVGDRRSLRA